MSSDSAPAPSRVSPFPLRIAAIDVGSNALRLSVAEFADATHYTVLEEERCPVRLGHQVFRTGRLDPAAQNEAIEALRFFATRLQAHEVARSRAVATSAVRESADGERFVQRVRKRTGVRLEVITGTEEARLIHLAVADRVPLADGRWMLMDLGGGSVEVSLVDAGGILWSESHTMGSVRLLEELADADDPPARVRQLLADYTSTLRVRHAVGSEPVRGLIATGGNIESLARMAGSEDPANPGIRVLPVMRLEEVIAQIAGLSVRERIEQLGLREDRADVILPAALVYERVAKLAGVREIHVPNIGLREGVLLDLADDAATHLSHEDRQQASAIAGALELGRRYEFDEPHAVQVARLAGSLFDGLRELHRLGADDRRILLAAAILHDIGQFVSNRKHHKHSQYLISHAELPGFSPREIEMVANTARYHRRRAPSPHHELYMRLAPGERKRVSRLAALLRLADALDREHQSRVRELRPELRKRKLVLHVDGDGDLLLERWAVAKKGDLFTELFGREVQLRTDAA